MHSIVAIVGRVDGGAARCATIRTGRESNTLCDSVKK